MNSSDKFAQAVNTMSGKRSDSRIPTDGTVLQFIDDMIHYGKVDSDSICYIFGGTYSYYFAHILKQAFGRGDVFLTAPINHFVWVDTDNTKYDVNGVYSDICICLIPEEELGEGIEAFMRVPGKNKNVTERMMRGLMLKHGFADRNGTYVNLGELAYISDKYEVLSIMCGEFIDDVLASFPEDWANFGVGVLASVAADKLISLGKP